jgi:hypothetical protein
MYLLLLVLFPKALQESPEAFFWGIDDLGLIEEVILALSDDWRLKKPLVCWEAEVEEDPPLVAEG